MFKLVSEGSRRVGSDRASVIIPTRDRGRVVQEAVGSAIASRAVQEIIVVDDSSSDETAKKLEAFGNRIRIIAGSFGSAAAARNVGANAATTEWLAFLDSDDRMLPDKVPCLLREFRDPSVGLAHGTVQVIDANGEIDIAATKRHSRMLQRAARHGTRYDHLSNRCVMFTSATVIRRQAFLGIGGYDESLSGANEDLDLYLRLSKSWSLVYSPCPAARYRIWPGNFDKYQHARGMQQVVDKHLANGSLSRRAAYGLALRLANSALVLDRRDHASGSLRRALRSRPLTFASDIRALRLLLATIRSRPERNL